MIYYKKNLFSFKSLEDQMRPCCKISQILQFDNTQVPDATYIYKVQEKQHTGFYHIKKWQPSWSWDLNHFFKVSLTVRGRLSMKYEFNWPSGFLGKEVIFSLTDLRPRSLNDLDL